MIGRLQRTSSEVRELIARIDVDTYTGAQARELVRIGEELRRAADALVTMGIGRVDRAGAWADGKARSTEDWVAATTGASWGEARAKVELASTLRSLPDTATALVEGRISESQAALVAKAATIDPHAEYRMLDLAGRASHRELRDAAQKVVATASGQAADEQAAVHRTRYLRTWTDRDGAFRIDGRLTKAAGAKVLAVLEPLMETEFADARHQGRRESPDAYRADALVTMAERASAGGRVAADTAPPSATVIVRVDHAALLRGHVDGDETCEIDGLGPVPVADVERLMGDPVLTVLRTRGKEVLAATTETRVIRKELRRAVFERDTVCVVPGCGVSQGLEIDHLVPFAQGGPTSIDNLQRLCKHHHRLKTAGHATLTRRETADGPQFGWLPRTAEGEPGAPSTENRRLSPLQRAGDPPDAQRSLLTG